MESIKEMDRETLKLAMRAARIHVFDEDNAYWARAIDLYKATGNKFDADCTGCRRRLVEWLER
jgi:hypothetical protein